jgi:hypothetical protein
MPTRINHGNFSISGFLEEMTDMSSSCPHGLVRQSWAYFERLGLPEEGVRTQKPRLWNIGQDAHAKQCLYPKASVRKIRTLPAFTLS